MLCARVLHATSLVLPWWISTMFLYSYLSLMLWRWYAPCFIADLRDWQSRSCRTVAFGTVIDDRLLFTGGGSQSPALDSVLRIPGQGGIRRAVHVRRMKKVRNVRQRTHYRVANTSIQTGKKHRVKSLTRTEGPVD